MTLFLALMATTKSPSWAQQSISSWVHQRCAIPLESAAFVSQDASSPVGSFVLGGGAQAVLAGGSSVWRYESDGSWIAEAVSLGNKGTQVFTEHGSYQNEAALLSAHDGANVSPVWSDSSVGYNFVRRVASAENTDLHVSTHQEYADETHASRHAVLRCFDSTSSSPRWTFNSPILIGSHDHSAVAISDDGQTIVLAIYDSSSGGTVVSVFGPDSATPTAETELSTLGGFGALALSSDGSTLAVSAPYKQTILDLEGLVVEHSVVTVTGAQYGDVAVSADGDLVALGTPGDFTVFQRGEQGGYHESYAFPVDPGVVVRGLALSEGGDVLIAGLQSFSQMNDARIVIVDLDQAVVVQDFTIQGAGSYQNTIQELACSRDGSSYVLGMWGDEQDTVPEVMVFETHSTVPLLADFLPGSVNDLDFSADGSWLAVASKGVHANTWGTGGSISLYRVGLVDLAVSGVPRPGATVSVEHLLREGSSNRVLVATGLLDTPLLDSSFGSGLLYLDPATIVELPSATAGEDHVAHAPLTLSGAVGSTVYIQAVDVEESALSLDWVQVTLLP